MDNFISVLKKWNNFSDRAGRREYWMFVLFYLVISIVLSVIDSITGVPVLGFLFSLALLVPGIAVTIRRLHDTDRSGWWILVALVPFVGFIVLLVLMVLPGSPESNQFGPPVSA
jgi:uncharacterized membrane protein YhaH (DUF805 family)